MSDRILQAADRLSERVAADLIGVDLGHQSGDPNIHECDCFNRIVD